MSSSPNVLWFVDRSAGEVTLLLLSAVVILGVARAAMPRARPVLLEGVHVNLGLLTIAFAGLHITAAILDPYARLGLLDATVPFVSAYRPTWTGLGVVSAYLYVAAVLSSWPARRLTRRIWIWLHRGMYAAWAVALVHSLGSGSDARNELFLLLDLAAVAGVLIAFLGLRVADAWTALPPLWAALAAVALVTTLGLGIWAFNGPLQPGWAHASGTPPDLIRSR